MSIKKYNREAVYRLLRFAEKNDGPWSNEDIWQDKSEEMITTDDLDLICAAPDLYDALMEAYEDWCDDHFDEEYPYRQEWAEKASAALKKKKDELEEEADK